MEKKINLKVKEKDKNLRIDVFISNSSKDISRTRIKNLILSKMNITKTKTLNRRNCKAYPEIEFFKNMNLLSKKYQTYYDKKPNRNKI